MSKFFRKAKDAIDDKISDVQIAVERKQIERRLAKERKWISEVTQQRKCNGEDVKVFTHFKDWKAVHEPTKEASPEVVKEKEPSSSGPSAVEKAIYAKLENNVRKNIVRSVMEITAVLLGPAEDASWILDESLAQVLNSAKGIALTYRFGYKNEKQFAFIRSHGVDALAGSIIVSVNKEMERLNKGIPESK